MNFPDNISCELVSQDEVVCNGTHFIEHVILNYHDKWFWIYLGIYVACVLFAGIMSGLTLGLLSLDLNSLNILQMAGTTKERKYAKRILPIIKHHHLLLVTLLLANAVAVEAMPLFMDKISNEITAIVVSVTAVLLFGEVIPQALCSRYGLAVGANMSWLVYGLMAIFFLISWPLSKLLDCLLGKDHATFFRRAEIKALVDLHGPDRKNVEDPLSYDEVLIIKGALEMRDKVARDAQVPIESVFMLDINCKLDTTTVNKILQAAHSRIPIYEESKQNIVGILLVKTILAINPEDATPIRSIIEKNKQCFREVFCVPSSTPLYDLLNEFQKGKGHLALVQLNNEEDKSTENPGITPTPSATSIQKNTPTSDLGIPSSGIVEEKPTIIGIITLEDVIEELLCEEIVDETDVYVDVHKRVLVARARASVIAGSGQTARGRSVPPNRQVSTLGPQAGQNNTRSRSAYAGPHVNPSRLQDCTADQNPENDDPKSPLISA